MKTGILALQGAFREHREALDACGADTFLVRTSEHLAQCDALVMPGGESTTISKLLVANGLAGHLRARLDDGLPVLATCAGLILLAREVLDGRSDQLRFGAIDCAVRRNGYGTQRDSFERNLDVAALDAPAGPFPGVFIRAPVIEAVGPDVDVLSTLDDAPVLVREGPILASTFHPELAGDLRLHHYFLQEIAS